MSSTQRQQNSSPAGAAFTPTHWSVVIMAGGTDSTHARNALVVGDQAEDARQLGAENLLVVGQRAVSGLGHRPSG